MATRTSPTTSTSGRRRSTCAPCSQASKKLSAPSTRKTLRVTRANAAAYDAQLAALDQDFRDLVSGAARTQLVFADRFPFLYFAREYGLSYISAFPGCAEESQPGVQAVAALIDAVEKGGAPVIYVIEMSTRDVARAVSEQTGAAVVEMHSCQSVTGEEFEAGETYVSLMTRNLGALREGLY